MYKFIILYALGFIIVALLTVRNQNQVKLFLIFFAASCFVFGAMINNDFKTIQILSGKITSKYRDDVSCEHSYSCSCNSDGECDTCYEHTNDYDWVLETNIKNKKIIIDRVDQRGTKEPPRFSNAFIGESAFIEDKYFNYFKMSKRNTIHSEASSSVSNSIEAVNFNYPSVYDYYKINRVISDGASLPIDNKNIGNMLSSINPQKQVNLIIIVTSKDKDIDNYMISVREKFYGGEKNDIFIIIQSEAGKILNSRVFSRSSNKILDEKLEFFIKKIDEFNDESFQSGVKDIITENFVRENYEQYAYLSNEISFGVKYIVIYVAFISLLILTMILESNSVFQRWKRF